MMDNPLWDALRHDPTYVNPRAGKLVMTKTGKKGKVYNNAETRKGKICVRLNDGTNLLCDPTTLRVYGYFD